MVLFLLHLAAIAPPAAPVQARMRLLDGSIARAGEWRPEHNRRQHERVETLPDGRRILLRITDHE